MARPLSPTITPKVEARFWSKVDKTPGQGPRGDCWCWTASFADRYPGGLTIDGYKFRAAQIALVLAGKLRPSMDHGALHSCDYPPCVRDDHLRWGTMLENIADACVRRKHSRGFTPDEIRAIRASSGRHVDVAREYNCTSACILNIRKRVSHKHVD